jgi:transposase InsO family protein
MVLPTVARPADLTIPKLSSNNYRVWSELMIEALEGRGVWDYVEGLTTKPSAGDEYRIWRQNNAVATGLIKGALSESQLGHVMGVRDAKEAWDILKGIHQVNDPSRVQTLLAEFVKFRLDTTIDEGASRLTRLQSEIGMLDQASKPSDTIKTETLLAGLGPVYEPTLVALEAGSITKFEDIVSRLRKVEVRLKGQGITMEGQNLARQAQAKSKKKKGSCYHCGKEGHFKQECRKLLAEQKADDSHKNRKEDVGTYHAAAVTGRDESETSERAWLSTHLQTVASKPQQTDLWYLDSAATSYMTNCKDLFITYKQGKDTVTVADGRQLTSQGQGTIRVQFGSEWVRIHQVLYVPGLQGNLLSIGQLAEKGIECQFTSQGATLRQAGETLANARREGRNFILYPIQGQNQGKHQARNTIVADGHDQDTPISDNYELWHRRLGHIGEEKMTLLQTTTLGVTGLNERRGPCETCAISKSVRTPHKKAPKRAKRHLQLVYTDFWGPYATPTPSGARYILTFTDDFTRKSWIYLTSTRTALYDIFQGWHLMVERQSSQKVQAIRSDNAREYQALAADLWQRYGILFEHTTPYTPEQNGVAERLNRTLTEKIRAMLSGAALPITLWGEAAYTACYLYNRTPRGYGDTQATPEEMWIGEKPSLGHLRVFGCVAYAQLAKDQRGKLDSTSIRGVFVGYTPTSRQYRVYDPETKKVERYSTVRFDETRQGGTLIDSHDRQEQLRLGSEGEEDDLRDPKPDIEIGDTIVVRARTPPQGVVQEQEVPQAQGLPQAQEQQPEVPQERQPERTENAGETPAERMSRSGRAIRAPDRYEAQQCRVEIATPTSYEEAISGPQKKQWEAAISDELQSLAINNVWVLMDTPKGVNIVSCKWVFKIKRLPDGQIIRYKARLVARGFTQQQGVDYDETFAPVVRMESLRMLLAVAAQEDLEIHQMDVVTAYLIGEDLKEEVYMEPPTGLPNPGGKVCRIRKGLYGLRQSARLWNKKIGKSLRQVGMVATNGDPSVWVNQDQTLILALYVDDVVLFGRDTQAIRWIKGVLNENFDMKDLGPISVVLGIRIIRDRATRTIWADQAHYVGDILREFQYEDCRPLLTPADGYECFQPVGADDVPCESPAIYQRALGELNWLVRGTRPDLAFVVHKLSQHCHSPCERHWKGV